MRKYGSLTVMINYFDFLNWGKKEIWIVTWTLVIFFSAWSRSCSNLTICLVIFRILHCRKEIGDFQIICSKVGGFRPFNYLLGVRCYLLSLKCKWLVLNKLCNFTAYKLFVSTNKQLTDPMDSMADPLFSSYSVDQHLFHAYLLASIGWIFLWC